MRNIISHIWKSLSCHRQTAAPPGQAHREFSLRYAHFRRLLTANNNALQAMADLEKMYYGEHSYRMAQIRIKTTAILVNVYKMITSLIAMTDGRHQILLEKFDTLSTTLEQIIEQRPEVRQGPYILSLDCISRKDRQQTGDKMANLAEAGAIDTILIPAGFVVTASATRDFLQPDLLTRINKLLQVLDPENLMDFYRQCADIQQLVMNQPISAELEKQLLHHYDLLEQTTWKDVKTALRSSALGEDEAGVSFAGLYRTRLNVTRSTLIEAYKEIIASKYSARAVAYRFKRGYRHEDIEMCVGCLAMIDPQVSGVTYSRDPLPTGSEFIRINATSGLGLGVVEGTDEVSRHLVRRSPPHQPVPSADSACKQENRNGQTVPLLSYRQLGQLARIALRLERHFGTPQDIEWSYDHQGTLFILQSRPVQERPEPGQAESANTPPPVSGEPPLLYGGITASEGSATGPVFRACSAGDSCYFPKGGVLLLEYPLPEYAPLVSHASAVIARSGSEAGHLATVCRELAVPALFGIGDAFVTLSHNQIVTLDATSRAIYSGHRDDVLRRKKVTRNPMTGSPVQHILTEALQHITPLNLNDPASAHFKAAWCDTLHDITRYCHEKSVTVMFNFSGTTQFDPTGAKRLVGDVPLEWWVINLADGFAKRVDQNSPTVRIEDIVSIPMLAIWQGVCAFPWTGPPPVSARGMGSIIFQSLMRPDLDPANPSQLSVKNYFLISRNFCNLSVRLGYHYAMVEAYVSELLTESYITFRFKGGAADIKRKTVRAKLLAEVLRHYGFSVELRSDSLLARIKQQPISFLQQRLQVLGYLILHSRQLDMVMDNVKTVERYKTTFISQIDSLLPKPPAGKDQHEQGQTVAG